MVLLRTKKIVITGLMIALGIVLPMAFHSIANAGGIFLPMHVPVMLCGFIAGPVFGVICGVLTPLFSSLMTGMPPIAVLPGMMCELATYGFITGLVFRTVRTKKTALNIYVALICAMLIGRGVSGFVNGLIFLHGKYTIVAWVTASFVTSLPGILIQLILIPSLIFALIKANLVDVDFGDVWGIRDGRFVKETKEFFDNIAERWDNLGAVEGERLDYIVSKCKIEKGESVLDIACGTGVIDSTLIRLGAGDVTAIDLSEKMIEIAKSKNTDDNITYYVQDFYKMTTRGFDRAVVYNAYPHFTDKKAFVRKLYSVLKEDGKFTLLHSSPPEVINRDHGGNVKKYSKPLKAVADEIRVFENYFDITATVDDGDIYVISGIKKSKRSTHRIQAK